MTFRSRITKQLSKVIVTYALSLSSSTGKTWTSVICMMFPPVLQVGESGTCPIESKFEVRPVGPLRLGGMIRAAGPAKYRLDGTRLRPDVLGEDRGAHPQGSEGALRAPDCSGVQASHRPTLRPRTGREPHPPAAGIGAG